MPLNCSACVLAKSGGIVYTVTNHFSFQNILFWLSSLPLWKNHFPNQHIVLLSFLSPLFQQKVLFSNFSSSTLQAFLCYCILLPYFWDSIIVPSHSFTVSSLISLHSIFFLPFHYHGLFRQFYLLLWFQIMTMLMFSKCIFQSKTSSLTSRFISLTVHLTFILATHIY